MARRIEQSGFLTEPGEPYILGATMDHRGCNFALFSKNATHVELLMFDKATDGHPSSRFVLDATVNKTGDIWHIYISGLQAGQLYGYVVDGPFHPQVDGHRFNPHKLLIDPYAKAIVGDHDWNKLEAYSYVWGDSEGDLSFSRATNFASAAKCAVVDSDEFDWERDKPLQIPLKDSIIYETHVRAFTKDASSAVEHPGTYLGMIEKIPYLKDLGITCVELLPIHEFNPRENYKTNPETGEALANFWGYSTVNFFSPCAWFATDGDGRNAVREFKEMVKAFHKAKIEVILDVVYNHTAEGNEFGPTLSFKGLDNSIYYMLERGRYYKNYSGCGNTLNCNHPVVRRLILDSLRYWVVDLHVDGFRFDLAAILGRDSQGDWIPNYSILNDIAHDPILSRSKIIAEGWDAAGLFKVGSFPEGWAEWNAHYRDDVRRFVKSDRGMVPFLATRIAGSSDLFYFASRRPYHSINFVTAHDGFTLHDLVSYNHKHNWSNGENNQDGNSYNLSWNCGFEGLSRAPDLLKFRQKQMRNILAILFLSQGTPMLLSGDEMAFSKVGNNNTYCHDNRLNWLDWELVDQNRSLFEFTKAMIHFRKKHPALHREFFFQGIDHGGIASISLADITWMGNEGWWPDWSYESHCLSFLLEGHRSETKAARDDNNLFVALNFYWEDKTFMIPPAPLGKRWIKVFDTASDPGFWSETEGHAYADSIRLEARSLVVLIERE